jgi:hypothetical protein
MELIEVSMRCSESGKLVRVIFSRAGERLWFEIHDIKSGSSVSTAASSPDALALSPGPRGDGAIRLDLSARALDAGVVSWNGFLCPHCRKHSSITVLRCGRCHALVCGATYRPLGDGRYEFSCGACGHEGRGRNLGMIESFSAKPSGSGAGGDVGALPPGKRLLGAAKRLLPRGKTQA